MASPHCTCHSVVCGCPFWRYWAVFFFEEDGVAVTVNSERYIHTLNNFLRPELRRRRINMRNFYFQQDGATAHAPMNVLPNMLPGCLTSRFGDVPWPPRSPDLSSCDFFLWGYLKCRVYTHKPRNLKELKDAIWQEVLTIDQQLLPRAMDDYKQRNENCIQEYGRHLNDIIFHT